MTDAWVQRLLAGDKLACARLISLVENEGEGSYELLKTLYPYRAGAYIIGVTGPPGAGKSTMVDKLAKHYAKAGVKIGILAIDPTSPFTKGAILGDRVRMAELAENPSVFIRSMGTRGRLGGLSKAASGAVSVLAAYGCGVVLLETVGVGQSEVDIVKNADTTLMVLSPGQGDDIQAIKAGIMEIGDVFVVNKADREGAHKTLRETAAMLDFRGDWAFKPPVSLAAAELGEGIEELVGNLELHRRYMTESGMFVSRREEQKLDLVKEIVRDRLEARIDGLIGEGGQAADIDPYSIAEALIQDITK